MTDMARKAVIQAPFEASPGMPGLPLALAFSSSLHWRTRLASPISSVWPTVFEVVHRKAPLGSRLLDVEVLLQREDIVTT